MIVVGRVVGKCIVISLLKIKLVYGETFFKEYMNALLQCALIIIIKIIF